ncbi:hypothetical protein SAMN04488116_1002 [Flagellimonas flava]|uniref:Uncharacterized protein n=2 Tax=Flagellimonas flava TaxID=570519 RepID=A0A1M5IY41_9FLAO|nr:hypothetical protein SAMN04488116_1002 [Allomuricauda flava]
MWDFKKILGFVLLTSLMLVKVSALHVYSHQEDDSDTAENCHLCDIAMDNQSMDMLANNDTLPQQNVTPIIEEEPLTVLPYVITDFSTSLLFSRPPPSMAI